MIKVITGPMFGGKSLALINQIEIYKNQYQPNEIVFIKSKIDTRDNEFIKSRDSEKLYKCNMILNLNEIHKYVDKHTKLVVIDEAQFLQGNVSEILMLSIKNNIDFIIAGLNLTSEQQPFKMMSNILSIATDIIILKARCQICNKPAEYTTTNDMNKTSAISINTLYYPICKDCLELILTENLSIRP